MNKEVLIIFKTHLDIGFTDYSKTVVNQYLESFIPNAIKVGNELKDTDTPFIWTVGSWLVWEALKHDKDGSVDRAIKDGIITWHGLPFTTHTETMNKTLFEYGISLSKKLDEKYGTKTIGSKMTDVPGHTLGMIPIMDKAGIEFLHIGVNPATPVPDVPPLFKWKNGDSEITVMYQDDYGVAAEYDDFIIYFAHTADNLGPQSADEIINIYKELQTKFPNCKLRAATLSDIALKVRNIKNLPVVEKDIGDTWIYGTGCDPEKVSRYRKLLRHIEENGINCDLSDNLLLVPEHTWGMDIKTHFKNDTDFTPEELAKIPDECRIVEKSWEEQREYVINAEKALGVTPDYPVAHPDLSKYTETEIPKNFPYEISWQLFGNSDYDRFRTGYMRCFRDWAIWDFTRIGLEKYDGVIYEATITKAYKSENKNLYKLEFDASLIEKYGLPYIFIEECDGNLEIKWFGKKDSRHPQAFWLKIKGLEENWEINKMDTWINPDDILDGNLLSAVDKGVRNNNIYINPLDTHLVAPYGRKLLYYGLKNLKQDLYFNLYNNVYSTNFVEWYHDDLLSRFIIEKR